MNEKIKEIAAQAGYNGLIYEISHEGLEKFATLIIKAVAAQAVHQAEFCELKMMPFSTMEWKIQDHFGVLDTQENDA